MEIEERKSIELNLRKEIVNTLNKSYFIEAGAGAGKTTTIVSRVIKQLVNENDSSKVLNPKEIAIITYTNAAAEELRTRLSSAVAEHPEVLKDFPGMKISTIHSFCMDILQNYCFDAKMPLDFSLIIDEDEDKLINDIFNKWSVDPFSFDYSKLNDLQDDVDPKSIIYELYFSLCKTGDETRPGFTKLTFNSDILLKCIEDSREIINKYESIKYMCENSDVFQNQAKYGSFDEILSAAGKKMIVEIMDFSEAVSKIRQSQGSWKKDLLTQIKNISKLTVPKKFFTSRKKCMEDLIEVINLDMSNTLNEYFNVKDIKQFIYGIIYQELWDYAYDAYKFYLENRPKNIVTNNSILLKTNKLLGSSYNRIRKELQEKFKCLYVDEYQDTSYLQDEIVWKLCTDEQGNLIPGSLIIVGDPKQSIYKFTGADVEVFLSRKKAFERQKKKNPDCCDVVSLNINFRSNNMILDYVNEVYSNKMPAIYSDMLVDNIHVVPEKSSSIAGFYKYDVELSDKDISLEGKEICKLIRQLLNCKINAEKRGSDGKKRFESRNINYFDIMVITDTTTNYELLIKEFKNANIPINLCGKLNQKGEFVVNAFTRLFRSLVDYKDKGALFGSIEMLKQSYVPQPINPTNYNEINAHYERYINSLREITKDYPCHAIAQYLLEHIEILYPRDVSMTYVEVLSAQKKIQQMVENAITSNFKNGIDYAEYFDKYASSDVKFELDLGGNDNAVRLMNFHQSKGLEANVVIYAKRDFDRSFKFDSYRDKNIFYPSIRNGWCSYYFDKTMRERIERETYEEMTRFEYVIATRAKEAVIFMNPIDPNKATLFNLSSTKDEPLSLDKEYTNSNLQIFNADKNIIDDTPVVLNRVLHVEKTKTDVSNLANNVYLHVNPSNQEEKEKGYEILRSSKQAVALEARKSMLNNRPIGNVAGNCIHRAMELFVSFGLVIAKIDAIIRQTLYENENDVDSTDYDRYFDFLKACMLSFAENQKHLFNDVKKENIFTEYHFEYFVNNELHNGSIDLLIKKDDSDFIIVDYKSDCAEYADEETVKNYLKTTYLPELSLYKKALQTKYGNDINVCLKIIYFRHYSVSKTIEVKELDL